MPVTHDHAQQALRDGIARLVPDYRPGYHLAPQAGWMNDPNGVVFFRGEYHVFYQHHPFDPNWGPIYWGHAKSRDLVNWQHLPIALAPGDACDPHGCFSGSAVVCGDTLALLYTGHAWLGARGDESAMRQVLCLATSHDGVHFAKQGAVIDTPPDASIMHFRDPKVWREGDHWYLLVGARLGDRPCLPQYRSSDLRNWEFLGYLCSGDEQDGYMWECPDLFQLNGRDVLLYSPQGMQAEGFARQNKFHTGYRIGRLDEARRFSGGPFIELDNGHDFYAAQTQLAADGRRLAWAWLDMWDSPMPSKAHHWCGMLGLPRELELHDDQLRSFPARELTALRQQPLPVETATCTDGHRCLTELAGDLLELEVQLDLAGCSRGRLGLALRCSEDGAEQTLLYYDARLHRLVLDRDRSGAGVDGQRSAALDAGQPQLDLRLFLDRSSIEVFAADGRFSLSSRVYPRPDSLGVRLFAEADGGRVTIRRAWRLAAQIA